MIDPVAEIALYSYKSEVNLSVFRTEDAVISAAMDTPPFEWSLRIVGEVPDSRTEGTTSTKAEFPIPTRQLEDPDEFSKFVRLCLIYWETHEIDEWLKKSDKRLFMPSTHGKDALSSMRDVYAGVRVTDPATPS